MTENTLADGSGGTTGRTTGPATGPVSDETAPRAHTMRFQGAANRLMRGLLRTPLICRGIGKYLITVYVVGRKSGKRYIVPVAYTRHDGGLLIGTPFGWVRNLRTGTPVSIRLKGKLREADVEVYTDQSRVVDAYSIMAADNHNFAKFNQIRIGADGTPNAEDLHPRVAGRSAGRPDDPALTSVVSNSSGLAAITTGIVTTDCRKGLSRPR